MHVTRLLIIPWFNLLYLYICQASQPGNNERTVKTPPLLLPVLLLKGRGISLIFSTCPRTRLETPRFKKQKKTAHLFFRFIV